MEENKKLEKYISKTNLRKLLGRILKDTCLIAPSDVSGEIIFQEVKSANEITFNYENCLNTPKDYLLLNDEPLLRYDLKTLKIKPSNIRFPKIIIFGCRPCDTRAVGLLDRFFSRNFADPLYMSKRKNTFIITLACGKLGPDCLCTSTGSGPYLENGFDIQLVDMGEGYFFEAASADGRALVARFNTLFTAVNADKKIQKKKVVNKARNSKKVDFDLKKVYTNLACRHTPPALWKDLAQRCQSCGGCLLICPNCSCFYVVDKKITEQEGSRVRSLDACYYEGFTRLSGGYNPLSGRETMLQRKFYHKLCQQLDEFGEAGCTGCGRCSEVCPGNINWRDTIKSIGKINNG
jgi:ferredoxin